MPSGSTETEGSGVSRFFCFDKLNHHKGIYSGLTPIFRERNVGVNPLVRQFGTGVQWHPADDLCEDCTVVVSEHETATCNVYLYSLAG